MIDCVCFFSCSLFLLYYLLHCQYDILTCDNYGFPRVLLGEVQSTHISMMGIPSMKLVGWQFVALPLAVLLLGSRTACTKQTIAAA